MSAQHLREFIGRHTPSATGLAALAALLDARTGGEPLDPALAARARELLEALGVSPDALEDLSPQEAKIFVAEIRHHLLADVQLLHAESRATRWAPDDERLLQAGGDFARAHAHTLTRNVIPALDGLAERLRAPSAAFLDIGVGAAGLAVELATLWPRLRVVGVDVWRPSLRLAQKAVDAAGMGDRIELREQSADTIEDVDAFDLAWVPMLFIPERFLPGTAERTLRALRPGGWAVFVSPSTEALDGAAAAFWRLRVTTWGGPPWGANEVERLLRDRGFVETRTLPSPPGVPIAFVVGRRRAA